VHPGAERAAVGLAAELLQRGDRPGLGQDAVDRLEAGELLVGDVRVGRLVADPVVGGERAFLRDSWPPRRRPRPDLRASEQVLLALQRGELAFVERGLVLAGRLIRLEPFDDGRDLLGRERPDRRRASMSRLGAAEKKGRRL
jgi:hypothetical protein